MTSFDATIDAHQHYWGYDPAIDTWIEPGSAIARDFAPEDVARAMDAAGIGRAIAVQARSSADDTAFLLDCSARCDWIAGVVGWLNLTAPDLAEAIAAARARGPLVGLRHVVQAEPDDFLARPAVIAGVRQTLAAGLSYDILIHARQLDALPRFLDRVGEGRLILDHGAKPPIATGDWQPWADGIAAVAAFPHVFCKLSGLVTEAGEAAVRAGAIARYCDHLLACFGSDRLLFGSDWPVCTMVSDYGKVAAIARHWVATRCPEAKDVIFGGNARRAYALAEVGA